MPIGHCIKCYSNGENQIKSLSPMCCISQCRPTQQHIVYLCTRAQQTARAISAGDRERADERVVFDENIIPLFWGVGASGDELHSPPSKPRFQVKAVTGINMHKGILWLCSLCLCETAHATHSLLCRRRIASPEADARAFRQRLFDSAWVHGPDYLSHAV
jgi:hypothetical protein